jgi:hypothetical protein
MRLIELDEKVIPYLLFNLAVRNIDSSVCRKDVLSDETGQQVSDKCPDWANGILEKENG